MINIPSLEEWIQNSDGSPLPVTAMVSLLEFLVVTSKYQTCYIL